MNIKPITPPKSVVRIPKDLLGYTTIRVSKKAHRELLKRAIAEKRTLNKQLDIILGI